MRWNVPEYQRTVLQRVGVSVPPHARVLDLGCGNGVDAEWFAQRASETIGLDLSSNERWRQIDRSGLSFLVGNAEALEFSDQYFDLIFLKDVLHHAESPERILREALRVCKPGGTIYVIEGNRVNPLLYVHMTLMLGHQHFRRRAFQSLVRRVFPHARFVHFEAHVYPFDSGIMLGLIHAVEAAIAATPLLRRLAAYNAAIATRSSP
jgi:ubiquinone/menaquinone biosynthesis C-methylase UbiE